MQKEILLNVASKEKRCALLKGGRLLDLVIERESHSPLTGNIYRGSVTNVLNNIQSAFIDINEGENGFIHVSDILENTQKFQEMFDIDFEWEETKKKRKQQTDDINQILKPDQPVLVQVVKEPIGSKGARLTSNLSIPGRYLVMLPNTPHRGVSRKIQDRAARDHLKEVIRSFEMPHDMGLICRTVSVNVSTEALVQEAHELLEIWNGIMEKFNSSTRPVCLYRESDLVKKSLLRAIDKKYARFLVDDYQVFLDCRKFYDKYRDEHDLKLEHYKDKLPMFERFGVESEIEKALRRKIWLPSGGYLYFDKTEAMTTIDVNSGRSRNNEASQNLEESIVQINMEAADEIARQITLRNIGGLLICDFIDMRSRKNQRRVLDRLKEAMTDDTAKCTILGMSEFGLVEMTRQRSRESLHQMLYTPCPYCTGNGMIKNHESVDIEIERALGKLINLKEELNLTLVIHPELDRHLGSKGRQHLESFAKKGKAFLKFDTSDTLHLNDFQFYSSKTHELLEV